MTDALQVTSNKNALEIGTGSGYQAAILGELAREIYTIEIVPQLGDRARDTLPSRAVRDGPMAATGFASAQPWRALFSRRRET